MLILTRKIGEKVLIGDDIEVQIMYMDRGQVRLGFSAPRDVKIYRPELLDKIKKGPIEGNR